MTKNLYIPIFHSLDFVRFIIVVLNYVFSKLIIFRKKDDAKKSDEKDEKNSGNAI